MSDDRLEQVGQVFQTAGWEVTVHPRGAQFTPDLLLSKPGVKYVAELKASVEGRADRVLALLAQAILQAQAYVADFPDARPLALVWTRSCTSALIEKVDRFHALFGRQVAIGIVTAGGGRHFVGEALGSLNRVAGIDSDERPVIKIRGAANLFSDLNQWMLKVLLAPQVPAHLLAAPRATYRTVSQLAAAADVSPMTASRFVATLREDGFLDGGRTLRLVRKAELSRRWKAHYASATPEASVRFLLPGSLESRLGRLFGEREACLGLFDAAARLNVGHVEGVPPYLYVRNLEDALRWRVLVPDAGAGQSVLVLKQALAPESLFRGREQRDGLHVADVIQIWLDSASHPSRGEEQMRYLENTVLKGVIGEAT